MDLNKPATQLPWTDHAASPHNPFWRTVNLKRGEQLVAEISCPHAIGQGEQNAAYIVRAVNYHQRLLDALDEAEAVYAILCSDGAGDIPARILAAQEHVSKWRALRKELVEKS